MFKINNHNYNLEFEFNNLKIIQFSNTTKLYRDIFIDAIISDDQKNIKNESIIYIDNFTKLNEFLELNKKSFLFELIISKLKEYQIINQENIQIIAEKLNQELNYDLFDVTEGDCFKIINQFFDINNNKYLDQKDFELIVNNLYNEPKLFIFNEIEWVDIEYLSKWINNHKFLILTNDFRKYINRWDLIETVCLINHDYEIYDVLDKYVLLEYLENKLEIQIENSNLLVDYNQKISWDAFYILNNIR